MKRILGLGIGALWLALTLVALRNSGMYSEMGAPDAALWWRIIAGILAVATAGAFVGSLIHTRTQE
jgi:hypothetical protein